MGKYLDERGVALLWAKCKLIFGFDVLPIRRGGTGGTTGPEALANLGYVEKINWTTLWEGTWSAGAITVPGINEYTILSVICGGNPLTATRPLPTMPLRASGVTSTASGSQIMYHVAANITDEILTLVFAGYESHIAGSNHSVVTAMPVTAIYGL